MMTPLAMSTPFSFFKHQELVFYCAEIYFVFLQEGFQKFKIGTGEMVEKLRVHTEMIRI